MSKVVRCEMLVMTNVDGNNNKFWKVEQHEDHSVQVTNGRVGSSGQLQPLKTFPNEAKAAAFVEKKIREKISGAIYFKSSTAS